MNGFKLGGLGAGDGTNTTGIFAFQRKNITIKNGIVRGFARGIALRDDLSFATSSGHVVKNILADQNTVFGIEVNGFGNTVSHNTVVDTGGSTLTGQAVGMVVHGSGCRVTDNAVSTTTASGSLNGFGISLFSADYSLAQNNTVTDTVATGTGDHVAIRIETSTGVFVRNNNLGNADNGLFFSNSNGKYFNNLTFNVITQFTGGTPVGNNNN